MKTKLSKRTIALLAAAVIVLSGGGLMASRAQLTVFSTPYNADFAMDHIGINLVENDKVPTDKHLLSGIKPAPGKEYKEEIAAANTTEFNQYARIIIRKYWMKDGAKDPTMDPALIQLKFDGSDFNTAAWQKSNRESTAEKQIYYFSKKLGSKEQTAPLFNTFSISKDIADAKVSEEKDGVTVYTYKYDGYTAVVEAEVQSIQTHNANDAIMSVWGVEHVKANGDDLTVTN